MRRMLRIALARKPTGSPQCADDADAGRELADRAAAVQHLERHVVGEQHQEDQRRRATARTTPGRRCESDAEREREDDRDLDHRVEEAGEEAGAESGEHQLERDALRRRERDAVVEEHMTNLDEFVRDRSPTWTELEQLVARGGNSPARLGPDGVLRLGACYRAVAADLALRAPPLSRPIRSSAGSNGSPQRGRHAVYNTTSVAQHGARVRVARLLAARARAARRCS